MSAWVKRIRVKLQIFFITKQINHLEHAVERHCHIRIA